MSQGPEIRSPASQDERPLSELRSGQIAEVVRVSSRGAIRKRLLALGLVPGTPVRVVRQSPLGDPTAYAVRGTILALRREEARQVMVRRDAPGAASEDHLLAAPGPLRAGQRER